MTFRRTLLAFGLGCIATFTSLIAGAQDSTPGDAAKGKVLAYTCHGCHGIPNYRNAFPAYYVPKLGGQNARYLSAALKEYAAGERPHPTMHSQAVTLSDQDRANVAAFLTSEPVPASAEVVGTPPPATQTCVACHGVDGAKTVSDEYPKLAGQHEDYILHALRDYKSGARKNPIMAGIIAGVKEQDFPALAHFFSQQHALCSTDEIRKHGKCDQQ